MSDSTANAAPVVTWLPADTAPKDRVFLADMGMPWVCLAIWNEPSGLFCITELEIGPFNGVWNDTSICHTYESALGMRGWLELPEVVRG